MWILAAALLLHRAPAGGYKIIDLGVGPSESQVASSGRAIFINNKGMVAGNCDVRRDQTTAFSYFDSKLRILSGLSEQHSTEADWINESGDICGAVNNDADGQAVVWSPKGELRILRGLTGYSTATCINDHGDVVGFDILDFGPDEYTTGRVGFRQDASGKDVPLPAGLSGIYDLLIDNRGTMWGEIWQDPKTTNGKEVNTRMVTVRVDGSKWQRLDPILSHLTKVNASGVLLGSYDEPGWESRAPEIWSSGKANQDFPGYPYGMNDQGDIVGVVYSERIHGAQRPFLQKSGSDFVDLDSLIDNSLDWTLEVAMDINDRGEIVGYGEHDGQLRFFLMEPE